MDKKIQKIERPDYKRIYADIIKKIYPEKEEKFIGILKKRDLTTLDIIRLNSLIFGTKNTDNNTFNQSHKSYDISTIREILKYQIHNNLNNTHLASHFKLSRNTITKWKKIMCIRNC